MTYQMTAVSGDCAGKTIEVNEQQALLIQEYQALSSVLMFTIDDKSGYPADVRKFLYNKMVGIQEQLKDNPFTSKHDFRSTWAFKE